MSVRVSSPAFAVGTLVPRSRPINDQYAESPHWHPAVRVGKLVLVTDPQCALTYRDLKVNNLLGERRDGVVEARPVFSALCRCEDVVPLPLLLACQDHLLVGARHGIVDIEGASRLDLLLFVSQIHLRQISWLQSPPGYLLLRVSYRKVECHLLVLALYPSVEARFLVRRQLVGEGCCLSNGGQAGQQANCRLN